MSPEHRAQSESLARGTFAAQVTCGLKEPVVIGQGGMKREGYLKQLIYQHRSREAQVV